MLPLAEGAVAAITSPMQDALGMEARKFVQAHLVCRMLPAEDAAALSAVMAALEEAKRFLARRGGAYRSGTIGLKGMVSTIG